MIPIDIHWWEKHQKQVDGYHLIWRGNIYAGSLGRSVIRLKEEGRLNDEQYERLIAMTRSDDQELWELARILINEKLRGTW